MYMLASWARTFFLCDIFRVRTSEEPCNSSLYSFTYNKTQELPQRVREHNDLRISERKEANQFRINEGVIHRVVIEM